MRPEMPYLAAGGIAVAGGIAKSGGLPKNVLGSVIGTVGLVIIASATADTPVAPLVRAIGLLLLLAAVMAAVPGFTRKK